MEFQVEGGYTWEGSEGKTEGVLEVRDLDFQDTDAVDGEVIDTGPGGTSRKDIGGVVGVPEDQDNYTPVLEFIKQPQSPVLAPVHWMLEKTEELNEAYKTPEQLVGRYEGGWNFRTDEDEDLMITREQYGPEVGLSLAMDQNPETEGDAYLELIESE